MKETKPQQGPGGSLNPASSGSGSTLTPSATPPAAALAASKGDCGCGGQSSATGVELFASLPAGGGMGEFSPSIRPGDGVSAAIGAWQSNKRFNGLWSINQNRNSWVHVESVGWKKLANASDSGIVALTMLSAHAREKSSVVNYRDESDGMIHEIYVW